ALPRGGVLVGAEIARKLHLPLDILVTRKIGAPFQPEVAIGAVTQDGAVLLHEKLIKNGGITSAYVQAEAARQRQEIARRLAVLRGKRPLPDWQGREVLLVDDGIATGFTVRAAIHGLRAAGAAAVWLAVPVAARDTMEALSREVDRSTVLLAPDDFYAVGQFYRDFRQIEDEEVEQALADAPR
ncbi:MAG: phosphoribosyltransferase, partial [Bacteroidota bacterium]